MPDAEVMKTIREHEERRPWAVLDMLVTGQTLSGDESHGLREALGLLAEDWRTVADLYMSAKLKGAQSTYAVPLRHAAAELDKVIKGLEQQRPTGEATAFSRGMPHAECPAVALKHGHSAHEWVGGQPGDVLHWCTGHIEAPTERPGLDALIAEAAGKTFDPLVLGPTQAEDGSRDHGMPGWTQSAANGRWYPLTKALVEASDAAEGDALGVQPEAVLSAAHWHSGQATADEVTAYLRGEVDELPGPDPGPSTVHDMSYLVGEHGPEPVELTEREVQQMTYAAREEGAKMPELQTPAAPPVPLLGQPGDAGAGYAPTYVPPGGVPLTFAELLTPVPVASLPPHLSHSQIGTIGQCPTKYRAQRLKRTPGLHIEEIPEWALIGGGAFHAAVEDIERGVTQHGAQVLDAAPPETLWQQHFEAECRKIEASSPVPRSRWRASKQGAEGETWWNANGPEMLKRYLAARPAEPTATLPADPPDPMGMLEDAIEIERTVDVPGPYGSLPYKAIIDRITVRESRIGNNAPWIDFIIRDYKTGARMPDDTSQLGEYANVLRLLGVPPQVKILGTFFNARKGTWTPEVDLLAEWSPEWFSYYVASGHAQRLALTTGPTPARPSSFCGGCPVRWACPIKGVKQR